MISRDERLRAPPAATLLTLRGRQDNERKISLENHHDAERSLSNVEPTSGACRRRRDRH